MNNTYTRPIQHQQNTFVPVGYKKTAIGYIPVDWKIVELSKLAVILFSNVDKHIIESEKKVLLCNYKDVYSNRYIFSGIKFSTGSVNENEYNKFLLKKGDVIITKDSEDSKDIAVPSYVLENIENLVCGYHLAIIRPQSNKLNGMYLSQLLQSYNINHTFQRLANGITRFGLNTDSVRKSLIPIPEINEQKKIAEILLNWDEAISIYKATINTIKQRNKGLAQQLLTGKKRLSGFSEKWSVKPLSDLLIYTPREVDKPTEHFLALGLRSHGKGVFHKPNFDPNAIAMTKLFEVKENDLVVNITFAWEQAIAIASKEDEGGLVSHRFPTYVFNPKTATQLYFKFFVLQSFFKSKLELISPGGAGRNRVMSKKDFLKLEVKVPHLEEQIAIAQVLETANLELKSYETKLEALQLQKKGLMQQLLTGKIRVNVK